MIMISSRSGQKPTDHRSPNSVHSIWDMSQAESRNMNSLCSFFTIIAYLTPLNKKRATSFVSVRYISPYTFCLFIGQAGRWFIRSHQKNS